VPTPDEVSQRMQAYFAQNRGKIAPPVPYDRNPSATEWHAQQDRAEQQQRDDRATANEDSSDHPQEGNNIRTNSGNMEGKVIRVDGNMVYFKLADGRPMKTSIRNITVIEKLADEDDEILEARVDEISDTVIAAYKAEVGNQKTAADKKGDYKKGDELYSKINKATLHQGTRTSRQQSTKEEINNPTDTVTVDVPLLIRIMEYAKEDAKTDLDLHNAAERLIELSQEGRTLTMDDYATMIGDVKEGGMGGINRCAPSNDVSHQDILNDVYDKWKGDTVKVKESKPVAKIVPIIKRQSPPIVGEYGDRLGLYLESIAITELDKSTLGSYIKKASRDVSDRSSGEGFKAGKKGTIHNTADETPKEKKRQTGIDRATDKLAK